LQSDTQGGSRMPELGPYGSVRGARGNSRPYRDRHVLILSFSANDQNVWSGRALQVDFAELAVSGLASMYPTFDWSVLRSWPSWISARVRSHYRTGLNGPVGSPVFAGAGKTEPPSRLIHSQTSAGKVFSLWLHDRGLLILSGLCGSQRGVRSRLAASLPYRSSAPRMPGHEREHSRRYGRACWPTRSPARCDAGASWPPRSRA
jgi:hypothetical protein